MAQTAPIFVPSPETERLRFGYGDAPAAGTRARTAGADRRT